MMGKVRLGDNEGKQKTSHTPTHAHTQAHREKKNQNIQPKRYQQPTTKNTVLKPKEKTSNTSKASHFFLSQKTW